MPSFLLGTSSYKALDGSTYQESVSIEHETPKARLIQISKRGEVRQHWIPKSVSNLRIRPKIRIINGEPVAVGEVTELQVADWFWEKEMQK